MRKKEIVLGIKQPTKYKWHKYEGSCNAAISETWLDINEIFMLGSSYLLVISWKG